jgi:hypothetical protein
MKFDFATNVIWSFRKHLILIIPSGLHVKRLALRACLGISGMKGNEGYWGGGISIISQNFSKSPSILFHPLDSSISQTSPNRVWWMGMYHPSNSLHNRNCNEPKTITYTQSTR